MAFTDIDKPSDYFETKLYTGNGGTLNVTGLDFAPNWVWIKKRTGASGTSNHYLFDSVRGASKTLFSNATNAEDTNTNSLTAFNSDGFSLGNDTDVNVNNGTFVSWNWKAGTSFSNNSGANGASLASTGSVSTTAGFSIISWTSPNSNANTIAHGLGSVPKMIIMKKRGSSGGWVVYHQAMGNTHGMFLSTTNAKEDNAGFFNDTSPTSAVFTTGSDDGLINNTMIAYCFSEKTGFSKFGSYTGNGNADGTFVFLGFKPAFVIVKRTDASNYWFMFDNKRSTSGSNPTDKELYPNGNEAEDTSARFDFLSNGFKNRINSAGSNASGATYIYMAFASNPFVSSSGVPATAK